MLGRTPYFLFVSVYEFNLAILLIHADADRLVLAIAKEQKRGARRLVHKEPRLKPVFPRPLGQRDRCSPLTVFGGCRAPQENAPGVLAGLG